MPGFFFALIGIFSLGIGIFLASKLITNPQNDPGLGVAIGGMYWLATGTISLVITSIGWNNLETSTQVSFKFMYAGVIASTLIYTGIAYIASRIIRSRPQATQL